MLYCIRWLSSRRSDPEDSVGEPNTHAEPIGYHTTSMTRPLSDRELLGRLVGFDTTSHRSNRPAADFVCEYLDRPGARITRHPNEDGEKVNVLAAIGPPREDRAGLILSGHLDVVPANEPDWQSDPFTLTERDGRLYGRGSCDMKASVALYMNLFREMDADALTAPLVLLFTYDEELGTLGAQHFASTFNASEPLPAAALVGEPTSLKAVRMHKGHLKMKITLHGQSAHSGSPHLGVNAIEPAGPLLSALDDLRRELEAQDNEHSEHFPEVPYPVLGITMIRGGEAMNVVPDRCEITLSIRALPGQSRQPIIDRIRSLVNDSVRDVEADVQVINDSPPLRTHDDAPLHRALCDRIGQSRSHGVSYASDGGVFNAEVDMQCVLFGPGTIEVAHKPNEFVPIDEFEQARPVVHDMIERFSLQS